MATGELPQPPQPDEPNHPDKFGMRPPREQQTPNEKQESAQQKFPRFRDDDDLYLGGVERYSTPESIFNIHDYDDFVLDDAIRQQLLASAATYAGGIIMSHNLHKTEPPKEVRDPYPSRAGWRAEFVPPFDPTTPEPKDKPKGKIGEYDIIESATSFEDIGGNDEAKAILAEISEQFKTPGDYEAWGVPVPKGVLLHGEPGTGKTMLAKAFAHEAQAAFVEVPAATLRSAYYGESEKNLQTLFTEAAKHDGPVVLFFDEIETLIPDRSYSVAGDPDVRLTNTFLQALDGMSSAKNVMVLGATNYKDRIDAAAQRAGRFDHKVRIELPDQAGVRQIVAKQLLSVERQVGRVVTTDELNIDEASHALAGLSGADIAQVIDRVKRSMVQTTRAMKSGKGLPEGVSFSTEEQTQLLIATDDIVAAAINYQLRK